MSAETGTRPTIRQSLKARASGGWDYEPQVASWMDGAVCVGRVAPGHDTAEGRAIAIEQLCSKCPVKVDCAKAALDNGEQYHVWGGVDLTHLTTHQRTIALKRAARGVDPLTGMPPVRGRGRPRKES